MTDGRCVLVHGTDRGLADRLGIEMDDVRILHSSTGDELGRVLTGGHAVAVLLVDLPDASDGERGWQRVALVHEQLPDLPIVVLLGERVGSWSGPAEDCPAEVVLRSPVPIGELSRVAREVGRLPVAAIAPGALREPKGPGRGVAVVGLGGGVGTTTVAALLAARSARRDRTILVDLDQRHGALAGTVRANPRYTTFDLTGAFDSPARLDDALPAALTAIRPDLVLLAARDQPDAIGARAATGDPALHALLRACLRTGDHVVADLGDLPLASYPLLDGVAEVVVVATHDIRIVRRLPTALAQLRDRAPGATVRTVLNRAVTGLEPGPRQLGTLAGRPWDVTIPETAALHAAQNDVESDGILALADAPPRSLEVALAALVDAPAGPREPRSRRRFPAGRRGRPADLTSTAGGTR
jgi:Flp pilus assembly CpaE family ATPase